MAENVSAQVIKGQKLSMADINRISKIESGGIADALSPDGGAMGINQIRKPVIIDWNQAHPDEQYQHTPQDMFRPEVNYKIADWYLNQRIPAQLKAYGVADTEENRVGAYNQGAKNIARGKIPTSYIKAYKESQI